MAKRKRGNRRTGGDARPLYVQLRDRLKRDIEVGRWRPGASLPSEFELAAEAGVSQGTMRKALDLLAQEQILTRRQGLGTFVAEHTSSEVLFRFFQFREPSGERVIPNSRTLSTRIKPATTQQAQRLQIAPGDAVIRHTRVRHHDARPFIYETIVLPEARFQGLGRDADLPNTLYDKFQRDYGVTVAKASEQLDARAAGATEARHLGVERGTPLLKVDRTTFDLGGGVIEWRLSLCHMAGLHYAVSVG